MEAKIEELKLAMARVAIPDDELLNVEKIVEAAEAALDGRWIDPFINVRASQCWYATHRVAAQRRTPAAIAAEEAAHTAAVFAGARQAPQHELALDAAIAFCRAMA